MSKHRLLPKTKRTKNLDIVLYVPSWAAKLYCMMAAVLLPWTIYLGYSLPRRHISSHWDIMWTGFDIGLIITILLTGYLAYRRSIWVVLAAATTGSILLADAWFDVMSERSGTLVQNALLLAIFFEIPLALMSYLLAAHALQHNTRKNK